MEKLILTINTDFNPFRDGWWHYSRCKKAIIKIVKIKFNVEKVPIYIILNFRFRLYMLIVIFSIIFILYAYYLPPFDAIHK